MSQIQTGPAAIGDVLKDTYEIMGFLGSGGHGVVYTGRHLRLGKPVAIKVLMEAEKPRLRNRFLQEARAAAGIRHPNIVGIYDYDFLETGEPYMVMDLLEGHDLEAELEKHGPMSRDRALSLIVPCLEGLGLAHEAGIVHKDLKPPNLFVVHPRTEREHLCVLDFGIARVVRPKTESALPSPTAPLDPAHSNTVSGRPVGTARYIAPEYIRNQHAVSPAVDVYQMGLILGEMISGEPVVKGEEGWVGLAMKHAEGALDFAPDVIDDPALGPILRRATARQPEDRFSNASLMRAALVPLILPEITGEGPQIIGDPPETRRGPPMLLPAVALAVVAVLGIVAFVASNTGQGPEDGEKKAIEPKTSETAPTKQAKAAPTSSPCPDRHARVDGVCAPTATAGMAVVPAGAFKMGCDGALDGRCQANEKPLHEVTLSAFEIDLREVSVRDFQACVDAGACAEPSSKGQMCTRYMTWGREGALDKPVNCVTFVQAKAYCGWKGGRLPTEAEWEKAARGEGPARIYPWGNRTTTCELACYNDGKPGCGDMGPCDVGARDKGASPYGALNMAGNVWEWTTDWFSPTAYDRKGAKGSIKDPKGPDKGTARVLRGGSFANSPGHLVRLNHRFFAAPAFGHGFVGFRCARDFP